MMSLRFQGVSHPDLSDYMLRVDGQGMQLILCEDFMW